MTADVDRANFEGHAGRECGEHRTVGPHRAWCYDCSEWCYPDGPCVRCEVPRLRAEIERAFEAFPDEVIVEDDSLASHIRYVLSQRDEARAEVERLSAECNATADSLMEVAGQRAAALEIHYREDGFVSGGSCAYCRDSDEDPMPWPCPTAKALGVVPVSAHICLAFPLGDSPGTRGCIALAEKAGIPVVVHEGVPA